MGQREGVEPYNNTIEGKEIRERERDKRHGRAQVGLLFTHLLVGWLCGCRPRGWSFRRLVVVMLPLCPVGLLRRRWWGLLERRRSWVSLSRMTRLLGAGEFPKGPRSRWGGLP